MPLSFQMMLVCILLAYLWQCRTSMQQRNLQTPESLLTRLRAYPNAFAPNDRSTIAERLAEIAAQLRQHPRDSKILWAFFRYAGIALESFDCAERISAPEQNSPEWAAMDAVLLASMRTHALQIRVLALTSLVKYALLGPAI
jgi:hypothetical protein